MNLFCKYCNTPVIFEPGGMMIESENGVIIVHEECYQMSGDDGGYIKRLHNLLGEEGVEQNF